MYSLSYPVTSALQALNIAGPEHRETAALVCHLGHAMAVQMRLMPANTLLSSDVVHYENYYQGTVDRWSALSNHLDATYANIVEKILWQALAPSILAHKGN